MKRISQLKDEAIAALSGNWGKAVLATLGLLVVCIAFSMVFQLLSGTNILDYYEALFTNDTAALMEAMGGNIYVTILQVLGGILFKCLWVSVFTILSGFSLKARVPITPFSGISSNWPSASIIFI